MESLRQQLRDATGITDKSKQSIPAVVIQAKNASGSLDIQEHYGYLSTKPDAPSIDFNTTMWVASCTKLVTSVAALQMVEQGLVDLDEDISRVLTEWKDPQILEGFEESGKPILKLAKNKLTLRHLLTHTSGMSYGILHPLILRYANYTNRIPEAISPSLPDHGLFPLLFEPGDGWHYGFSTDWVGVVVERLSGYATLGEYFAKHVWGPLGLNDADWTFRPQTWLDKPEYSRVEMQMRQPDGSMKEVSVMPLPTPGLYDGTGKFDSGGGGLYMKPVDFMKLLESLMLNNEVLLKKETRDQMFIPQLPDNKHLMAGVEWRGKMQPPFCENPFLAGLPLGTQINWGLGGMLMMDNIEGKRKPGTMWWDGLPNLFWWIDPASQLTGFWATQIFPTGEKTVLKCFSDFEKAVYQELNNN